MIKKYYYQQQLRHPSLSYLKLVGEPNNLIHEQSKQIAELFQSILILIRINYNKIVKI